MRGIPPSAGLAPLRAAGNVRATEGTKPAEEPPAPTACPTRSRAPTPTPGPRSCAAALRALVSSARKYLRPAAGARVTHTAHGHTRCAQDTRTDANAHTRARARTYAHARTIVAPPHRPPLSPTPSPTRTPPHPTPTARALCGARGRSHTAGEVANRDRAPVVAALVSAGMEVSLDEASAEWESPSALSRDPPQVLSWLPTSTSPLSTRDARGESGASAAATAGARPQVQGATSPTGQPYSGGTIAGPFPEGFRV